MHVNNYNRIFNILFFLFVMSIISKHIILSLYMFYSFVLFRMIKIVLVLISIIVTCLSFHSFKMNLQIVHVNKSYKCFFSCCLYYFTPPPPVSNDRTKNEQKSMIVQGHFFTTCFE